MQSLQEHCCILFPHLPFAPFFLTLTYLDMCWVHFMYLLGVIQVLRDYVTCYKTFGMLARWKERAKWQTAGGLGKGNCSSTLVLPALTSMAMCNGTVLGQRRRCCLTVRCSCKYLWSIICNSMLLQYVEFIVASM